jgi:hypothetical protein
VVGEWTASADNADAAVFCLLMLLTSAQLVCFLAGEICFWFVLQFVEHDAFGAIKLPEIASRTSYAHPALDFVETAEGNRGGSEFAVGRIKGIIRCVLMMCIVLVSTLDWAGSSDKIAKVADPLSRNFLSFDAHRIALLHEIGVAVVFSLCIANGGGSSVQ